MPIILVASQVAALSARMISSFLCASARSLVLLIDYLGCQRPTEAKVKIVVILKPSFLP